MENPCEKLSTWKVCLCLVSLVILCLSGNLSPAQADNLRQVGTQKPFPQPVQSGTPVAFSLWQWGENPADRKEILKLKNGLRIPYTSLPKTGMHFKFRIPAPHDTVVCLVRTSDSFDQIAWGPEKVELNGSAQHLYRAYPEQFFYPPQVGRYCISVEAKWQGKPVAHSVILFEIINPNPVPRNTAFLKGKKDSEGNLITSSNPVELTRLNETPILKDNDYAFEPQHAYNVINYERFPPFHLPKRFIAIWNSRRFTEEAQFGGPLNRGFTHIETIQAQQDNLPIAQRAWFHTPDLQVSLINEWYKKEPEKYTDLKAYADYRSAFVSAENAYALGRACYEAWGAGGYGPYDAGLYGWDEEQMWPALAAKILKEHPELLPERLRRLRDKDPNVEQPDTLALLQDEYARAWGDFIGHGYRGARDVAAERGRAFKIWHYGSKAPGEYLFVGQDNAQKNPETGQYRADELDALWSWFKKDGRVDFNATEYSRQIDYFHKDFYYHTLFPEQSTMYEKDAEGRYALDEKGRRKIRRDLFEEKVYVAPVKVGYEDSEIGPVFLKAFLSKGENALYFMNGGKYYKRHGTLLTDKQLIPALRPGNQETWGESAQLGSRPVNPYLAEAASIYTFMMGLEGLYFWDSRLFTGPAGYGRNGTGTEKDTLGDIEFIIKGMHRVSQFNALFEGDYTYIRPVCHYETYNRDHPLIRGILNGSYLALAMTNPYLDPGETQQVEVWYDAPYRGAKKPVWSGKVTLKARKTHLFQCRLPALPGGKKYDPDRLYFRYTCVDGNFRQTFTVTGNYEVKYPY